MALASGLRKACMVLSLSVLAESSAAHAQAACAPGLVAVDDAGHCCATGQQWNATVEQCVGTAFQAPPAVTGSVNVTLNTPLNVAAGMTAGAPSGAQVNPDAPVTVTFIPEQAGDLETLQIAPITGQVISCNLPCIARLPPGYVTITGAGQRLFESGINIPPGAPLTVRVNHWSSNTGVYVRGGLISALGVGMAIAGGVAMNNPPAGSSSGSGTFALGIVGVTMGSLALLVGPTMLLVAPLLNGDPLTVVPPGQITAASASQPSSARFAGITPMAVPGGGGVATGFTF